MSGLDELRATLPAGWPLSPDDSDAWSLELYDASDAYVGRIDGWGDGFTAVSHDQRSTHATPDLALAAILERAR